MPFLSGKARVALPEVVVGDVGIDAVFFAGFQVLFAMVVAVGGQPGFFQRQFLAESAQFQHLFGPGEHGSDLPVILPRAARQAVDDDLMLLIDQRLGVVTLHDAVAGLHLRGLVVGHIALHFLPACSLPWAPLPRSRRRSEPLRLLPAAFASSLARRGFFLRPLLRAAIAARWLIQAILAPVFGHLVLCSFAPQLVGFETQVLRKATARLAGSVGLVASAPSRLRCVPLKSPSSWQTSSTSEKISVDPALELVRQRPSGCCDRVGSRRSHARGR